MAEIRQPTADPPRLLYLITVDWFFVSHFLERAEAARQAGYEVVVMARLGAEAERLRAAGLRVVDWPVARSGVNPLRELRSLWRVVRAYRRLRPTLVHHVALKPILYGSIAARLCGIRRVLNAPVGMGFVFASGRPLARLMRPLMGVALRALLNPPGSRVVFENRDDLAAAERKRLVRPDAAVLIRGAGIDLSRAPVLPEPSGRPRVLLVARMLWDKGVGELVAAARQLKAAGVDAEFVLVGAPDAENRACIPEQQLRDWQSEGLVTWLGHRDDVMTLLAGAAIVTLPSYREGLPKSLLEALAAARPVVATDVPGCREVVIDGETGFLVPPRDPVRLAEALAALLGSAELRQRFGAAGRRLAEQAFSSQQVCRETMRVYSRLLEEG
ncbi:glycosyltransferase family 4 protein [Thiohalocapsa marina]|uniref:Glycosyltransferase family 4 protein n=2 Tax=Thiohalocapsa marina TaxID=424902 RepID=A0A5M8FUK9_9GAMM|nr:glycosyltransferase family 4 protein [Thiohalocapsa marina]